MSIPPGNGILIAKLKLNPDAPADADKAAQVVFTCCGEEQKALGQRLEDNIWIFPAAICSKCHKQITDEQVTSLLTGPLHD